MFTSLSFDAVIAFIFGVVVGSFLNVVAYRVPRGESVVAPRSNCPSCHTTLTFVDLLPVISWLTLGGRCRYCRVPISVRYPVIELITGALWAATVLWLPNWHVRVAWAVFWALLVSVLGTDLTAMRVPNLLSLPGAGLAMVLAPLCGVHGWGQTLLGAGVGAGVLFAIHLLSRGNMGMGDVKLYLSIGALLGPLESIESLVIASLSGVIVGYGLRAVGWMQRREHMPFVPHIAIGVIVVAFFGPSLTHWYINQVLVGVG